MTTNTRRFEWDRDVSSTVSPREAAIQAIQEGQSFVAFAEDHAAHWDEMFPGEEMPDDLIGSMAHEMRAAIERPPVGRPAGTQVTLYEDNAGGLYIARDDQDIAYVVTFQADDPASDFEQDAVALLQDDIADWIVDTVPLDEIISGTEMSHDATTAIARYDDTLGRVVVYHADWGRVLAGGAGRAYLRISDED